MIFTRSILESSAEAIRSVLEPYSRMMVPTGPLRRQAATGATIDFIVVADDREKFVARCLERTFLGRRTEWSLAVSLQNGLGLNIWFARPPVEDIFNPRSSNSEVLQVIHTPTPVYLREFLKFVRSRGYRLAGDRGLMADNDRLVSATEAGIYDALDIALPEPERQLVFRPEIVRDAASF